MREWQGDNPWYLELHVGRRIVEIDLDKPRWLESYADELAAASEWRLQSKTENVVVVEKARPGMRYICRNFRRSNRPTTVRAYGFLWDGGGFLVIRTKQGVWWGSPEEIDVHAMTALDRM